MEDKEKFEGFKQSLIDENEAKYGKEIREKYGEETINASNNKFKGMTKEQHEKNEKLSLEIAEMLKEAMTIGEPGCEQSQEACDLHRQWICMFWADGMYSKEAHMNLAQMYCDDERFKAYYEAITPGSAEFLRDAMKIYTNS